MSGFAERGGRWVAAQFAWLVAIVAVSRFDLLPFGFPGRQAIAWGLILLAVGAGIGAALSLGPNLTPYPKPVPAGTLVEHGLYRMVRHPIYTAVIVGMVGVAMRAGDLVSLGLALGLVPFFFAKSEFEERHLVERFPDYAAYRRRVRRRLIPGLL